MSELHLNKESESRSQKWDILKFLMIFLVVVGHVADYYTTFSETMRGVYLFIYVFHMPVFFFVSGLFSKRTVDEKRKEKVFGFLIMYVFMKAVIFFAQLIAGNKPVFDLFSEGGFPWYLLATAFSLIATMFVKEFSPKYVFAFSILVACFAGYSSDIGNFLCLSRFIVFYPFFYLGYVLDREKVESFCSGKAKKILSAVLILSLALLIVFKCDDIYWTRLLLTGRNPYSSLGDNSHFGFFFRLVYYIVASVIGFAVVTLAPQRTPRGILAKLGRRTLSVYVFHYVVLYYIYSVFGCKVYLDEWAVVPLAIIITLLFSPNFFNVFLQKIMNVPLRINKK